MENPFGKVNSPFPPLSREGLGVPAINPSLLKGGAGVSYENRRAELSPRVREYADKMFARLLGIYKKYGAKDAAEMQSNVLTGKGLKLAKKDVEELAKLLDTLDCALSKNELPEGHPEQFPPYEAFRKMVDEINKQAAPEKVYCLDRWENYELIDGKLNGAVFIKSRWLPVINGELVSEIMGQEILWSSCVRNVDGKLNGMVGFDRPRRLPIIDGKVIEEIDGEKIDDCANVENIHGKLNGVVTVSENQYPVIAGKLIKEFNGKRIERCDDVHIVDGKLNGGLQIGGRELVVIAGEPIEEIDGLRGRCDSVHNVDDKLNGRFRIESHWLPIIAGNVIKEIDGHHIKNCLSARNVEGKLNGAVEIVSGNRHLTLPVIAGKLIEDIDGRRITWCEDVRNVDGELNGRVKIGESHFPVIAGKIVKSIGGLELVELDKFKVHIMSEAGGRFSGEAKFKHPDGTVKLRSVVLGEFID